MDLRLLPGPDSNGPSPNGPGARYGRRAGDGAAAPWAAAPFVAQVAGLSLPEKQTGAPAGYPSDAPRIRTGLVTDARA